MKILALGRRAQIQKSQKTLEKLRFAYDVENTSIYSQLSVFGLSLRPEFNLELFQKIGRSSRVILIVICPIGDFDFEILTT